MKLSSPFKAALMLSVCVLLFSFAAQAQTVRANIPFAFVAGDRMMPAGEYQLSVNAHTGIVKLRPEEDAGFYLTAHDYTSPTAGDTGVIVFHKYGDSYFLKRVQAAATREGYELNSTRGERDAARRSGAFEVAMVTTYNR